MPRDFSNDEDWEETLAELREQRDRSRSSIQRKRLNWAISKAESLRSSMAVDRPDTEVVQSRRGRVPCPMCGVWFYTKHGNPPFDCSNCGTPAHEYAVYDAMGFWRFIASNLLICWGTAASLLLLMLTLNLPLWVQVIIGISAVGATVLGVPNVYHAIRMCSWKLRGSPKSRLDG